MCKTHNVQSSGRNLQAQPLGSGSWHTAELWSDSQQHDSGITTKALTEANQEQHISVQNISVKSASSQVNKFNKSLHWSGESITNIRAVCKHRRIAWTLICTEVTEIPKHLDASASGQLKQVAKRSSQMPRCNHIPTRLYLPAQTAAEEWQAHFFDERDQNGMRLQQRCDKSRWQQGTWTTHMQTCATVGHSSEPEYSPRLTCCSVQSLTWSKERSRKKWGGHSWLSFKWHTGANS